MVHSDDSSQCQIGEAVSAISPEPVSVVAFGSFARGEADTHSDIDLAVVRADDVDDDDDGWAESLDAWRRQVRALTGNDVEIIEATASEATRKLRSRSELWRNIKRDGIVVYGRALDELAGCLRLDRTLADGGDRMSDTAGGERKTLPRLDLCCINLAPSNGSSTSVT